MHRPCRPLPLIVFIAVALLFAACGGGSTNSGTDSAAGQVANGAGSETEPTSSSSSGEAAESPIEDLLGIPLQGEDADEYFANLGQQAEVKIAECMIAQGFEYEVIDYSGLVAFDSSIDFDSREFAEEYGFGIASNPFEESFEVFESFEDPNDEYVTSLSVGEREAYDRALNGEISFDDLDQGGAFEPGGCQGQAFEEVFAFGQIFDEFGGAFEEIEAAYEADPRIVGASSGWAECMTAAGYRYADQDGAEEDINGRYQAIVSGPDAFVDGDSAFFDDDIEIEDDGEEVFIFGPQTLAPEAQEQVDQLAVEERVIATASWDCNEPVREIEDEVWLEYEQRFVDENGAAIRAALDE